MAGRLPQEKIWYRLVIVARKNRDGKTDFRAVALGNKSIISTRMDEEGPGIDFDDAEEWNKWYFGQRGGGHPWEIIRGGNSTHVDLFVCHDEDNLGFQFRLGKISEDEYKKQKENAEYYFRITGKHRPKEAVTFYTTLSCAGLPVILDDTEEILARFDGSDFVGIVPHSTIPKYCEGMFPKEYGRVIDFMHVYDEEMQKYGDEIAWIPEEEARIL